MKKKIFFALGILIVVTIVFILYSNRVPKPQTPLFQMITSYPDEPKAEATQAKGNKISSTPWITPNKPEIIKPDNKETFLNKQSIEQIWKDNPHINLKQKMKKLQIDQKYYHYFYDNGLLPMDSVEVKIAGDGISYPFTQSIGVGCGSCELQYMQMFIGDKTYSVNSTWGSLSQRADGKGFYLMNAENDYAINVEKETIKRFQWNGDGFTEVGEKTIRFALK
ncbi:MAG TPA: hypothetical protein VNW29_05730 [Candidatus Sulfotelmatobacter sp.]|jgi:hypothetical protein|nr:hypothetical protein [Candidatus Sulfotelmatobacter sp.]